MTTEDLARTPLFDEHQRLGGRLVPFAGFAMPVQYEGVVKEHQTVREAAGLFDVSHMGELWLRGDNAQEVADSIVTNWVGDLSVGRAKYTVACNESGTILDDLIVYRPSPTETLIVCNASNHAKMSAHFQKHTEGRCAFDDATARTALIALQGPRAADIAREAGFPDDVLALKAFGVGHLTLAGAQAIAARTGYTGEDGFELFVDNADAVAVWRHLLEVGASHGIAPAGLGARDTLRLEAALCLYGNDIDETTNPYEAGLGWVVKLDRNDFIGRAALTRIREEGPSRKLVGLEMIERGIARHGYPVIGPGGDHVGIVTSGSPAPTLGKNIALAYVPHDLAELGTELSVEIRNKRAAARVVKTPFYKRR